MCYDPRHHPKPRPFLTRREMLPQTSTGFGMLALSALMADPSYAGLGQAVTDGPLAAKTPPLAPRGEERHLLLPVGGALARRLLRSQTAARG